MRVSMILQRKGADVQTVAPEETLRDAAQRMADHNVGALVISTDGRGIQGIVSERDIVRCIADQGPGCLDAPVSDTGAADVVTCGTTTTIDELMAVMTERRIRHVPVLHDGQLAGIVSIGDVVKSRLDELEVQAQALSDYVSGSRP